MLSQVKCARGRLAAVRTQVLSSSPAEVEQCIPALQDAIACLQGLKPGHDASLLRNSRHNARWRDRFLFPFGPRHAAVPLLTELRGLQFEIGVVSRLAKRSEAFYEGWAQVLAAMAAGYTASTYTGLTYTETGNPAAPPAASGSLSVRG